MIPSPQQMPMPSQMTAAPSVPTAYNQAMAAKMSPFAKAKYGMGGFTPASQPTESGQIQRFAPSGNSVSVPRLQPLQFGGST